MAEKSNEFRSLGAEVYVPSEAGSTTPEPSAVP
jgi:hypothetical protein